jgi:aquaporin NIP
MKEPLLFKRSLAEALGTFTLVFAGCGALMVAERFPGSMPAGAVPAAFGLAIACMIYAVGHISGGHFNPAVSLGLASVGALKPKALAGYLAGQFVGALAAIALLSVILPQAQGYGFGVTLPRAGVTEVQALIWEAVLTFFLVLVICGVATDKRGSGALAGLAIGGTIALDAIVGGPVTGASMNPARSLAPALWQGQVQVLWIYFLGPIAGAVAAAQVYKRLR